MIRCLILSLLFVGCTAGWVCTGVNLRKDRRTNQPRGFGFVTFEEDDAAREAVASMQGHSYQGRVLTVNTADARGTAAANAANGDDDDDDSEWKTAPPARKNNTNNSAAGGSDKGKGSNKGNSSKGKKSAPRSWNEWAAPTVKTSQREVPQSVPLVSPEATEKK